MVRKNEYCLKIRELFSPALDQEITPKEKDKLQKHLEECAACHQEWLEWQEISTKLRGLKWDCLPPSDFSRKVMQKIAAKPKKQPARRINRWKALGGIAAALALATGTVTWVDHLNSAPPSVAIEQPHSPVVSDSAKLSSKPAPEIRQDPEPELPNIVEQSQIAAVPPQQSESTLKETNPLKENNSENTLEESSQKQENTNIDTVHESDSNFENYQDDKMPDPVEPTIENTKPEDSIIETQIAQENVSLPLESPIAFLNKSEIKIDNTLLKLESANINDTTSQVSNLAAIYGVPVNTTSNSASVQTVTMTIDKSQSQDLLASLGNLATVVSTTTETNDLTYRYKEAISRYQELQGLTDSGNTEQQIECETLKKQIQDWEAQDGKETITVWIEKIR